MFNNKTKENPYWFNEDFITDSSTYERAVQYFLIKLAYENYSPVKIVRKDNLVSLNFYFIHKSETHFKCFSIMRQKTGWLLRPINDNILDSLNTLLVNNELDVRESLIFFK